MKTAFTFKIEPWKTVSEELVQATNIFDLYQTRMRLESEAHEARFSVLKVPDWINVMALVVLVVLVVLVAVVVTRSGQVLGSAAGGRRA